MKITIDRVRCMASGNCVLAAPKVFGQDEEGYVEVLDPSPPADSRGAVEQAAAACPAAVITITDD